MLQFLTNQKKFGPVKRILIVSFDAVGTADLEYLQTLPNFKRFMAHAAYSNRVETVYPSLTYPAHTSIVTGLTPAHHGVVNNLLLQPQYRDPDWMWERKYVKGPTLYDAVKEQRGFRVSSIFWPVTAKAASIKYNVPEILAIRPWHNQILRSLDAGSTLYEVALMKHFGKILDGSNQPNLDNFAMLAALDTQFRFMPEMMLLHLTDVDTLRHKYGVHAPEVKEALKRHDKRLGELLACLSRVEESENKGRRNVYEDGFPAFENTAMVILGDHYQKDIHTMSYPNHFLWRKGYIKIAHDRVKDYSAYAQTADGACYIYVNREKGLSGAFLDQLEKDLHKMARIKEYGIAKIFDARQAASKGADPNCAFMLEGRDGYAFGSDYLSASLPAAEDEHKKKAVHGYLPGDDSYTTFFAMTGAGVEEGAMVPRMKLIDEGPTIAKFLGINIGMTDGKVIEDFLRPEVLKRK